MGCGGIVLGEIEPGFVIENFRDRSQGEKCQDHVKLEKDKKAERLKEREKVKDYQV